LRPLIDVLLEVLQVDLRVLLRALRARQCLKRELFGLVTQVARLVRRVSLQKAGHCRDQGRECNDDRHDAGQALLRRELPFRGRLGQLGLLNLQVHATTSTKRKSKVPTKTSVPPATKNTWRTLGRVRLT